VPSVTNGAGGGEGKSRWKFEILIFTTAYGKFVSIEIGSVGRTGTMD
jgi:hypothetical protein